jgi:GT2 family glycosyltransferase
MGDIGISIVLFNTPPQQFVPLVLSALACPRVARVWLIDHSPRALAPAFVGEPRVTQIHDPLNPGFGAGHNRAMRQSVGRLRYHAVINPDIQMAPDLVGRLAEYLDGRGSVALVMPTILDPDGGVANQGRLLPCPWDLVGRRWFSWLWGRVHRSYEIQLSRSAAPRNLPNLSGAFLFLRCDALEVVGLFDEQFFLYCEDIDLVRRLHHHYRTEVLPHLHAVHEHQRASYKTLKMTLVHCRSAFLYFAKWGWFHDPLRRQFNRRAKAA